MRPEQSHYILTGMGTPKRTSDGNRTRSTCLEGRDAEPLHLTGVGYDGIEPSFSSLRTRRDNHYSNSPLLRALAVAVSLLCTSRHKLQRHP